MRLGQILEDWLLACSALFHSLASRNSENFERRVSYGVRAAWDGGWASLPLTLPFAVELFYLVRGPGRGWRGTARGACASSNGPSPDRVRLRRALCSAPATSISASVADSGACPAPLFSVAPWGERAPLPW